MRIIGGTYGGRRISPPANMPHTRPTTDIAKEGLFNILQHKIDFEGMHTLDLFGGTGCISYELAGRGAADLTIVEKDSKMYDFIKKTVEMLRIANVHLIKSDVFNFINTTDKKFDLIFAGPPYAMASIDDLPLRIFEKELLNDEGIFILEHTPRNDYRKNAHYIWERNYGTTVFSAFE